MRIDQIRIDNLDEDLRPFGTLTGHRHVAGRDSAFFLGAFYAAERVIDAASWLVKGKFVDGVAFELRGPRVLGSSKADAERHAGEALLEVLLDKGEAIQVERGVALMVSSGLGARFKAWVRSLLARLKR